MNRKHFVLAAIMLLIPVMMGAQTLKGSYFLDNSLNRNKLNPAFEPTVDYFQMPVIGNIGAGVYSNIKLKTFLYPMDGNVYTFLNKNISLEQFDAALMKNPYLDIAADVNLINFGWKRGRGFWTVDIGLRVNGDIDVPRDLFIFMKQGASKPGTYNIGNAKVNAAVTAQAAVGYSRDLSDVVPGLRVGAKVRAILPVGYIGGNIDELSLTTSPDKWTIQTDGVLHTAAKGFELIDAQGNIAPSFNGPYGLAGFGFSVDLGAEYKLDFDGFINGVHFSAAVTDLGYIFYNKNIIKAYKSNRQMEWTGLEDLSVENGISTDIMDQLKEDFEQLLILDPMEDHGKILGSTTPSIYLGAEMPFLNNTMSVGLLYSARMSYKYTRHELTLSYNANPLPWLGVGINYSFINAYNTIGWILEFIPKAGPCFYIGSDYFLLEWAKAPDGLSIGGLELSHLPMSLRLNVQLGLSFSLGRKD